MKSIKYIFLTLIIMTGWVIASTASDKIGDHADGSRAKPVHRIELFDEEGSQIFLDDQPVLPFSPKQTCLPCHAYEKIHTGWHFNAQDTSVDHGRAGHPWILSDRITATQIPLSYRGWEGTYKPEEVDLTPFYFLQKFGNKFPGGGVGENDSTDMDDVFQRWYISGKAEVNCLACHDAAAAHDQTKYAIALRNQNFRWAAAATSDFATVNGSAKSMHDGYDIYAEIGPSDVGAVPPTIEYDKNRFNEKSQVFFDIAREVPNERCYFCHSTAHVGSAKVERWETDKDVHLTSGMNCVDCHRNGLDHMIVRGYEGEPGHDTIETLSCEGCHIAGHDKVPTNGRLGAPIPKHTGIPTIHFEELSCTACHSGPWPEKQAGFAKTALSHGLGNLATIKADTMAPFIASPVFAKGEDDKIAPHHVMWPSFWGVQNDGEIAPMNPADVQEIVLNTIKADTLTDSLNIVRLNSGKWAQFTDTQITSALQELEAIVDGTPVFVNGGYVYSTSDSVLTKNKSDQAAPYSWAIAHDVRPAGQSLGSHSCKDCHAVTAGFSFGKIIITNALDSQPEEQKSMLNFQEANSFYDGLFAITFYARPLLKLFIVICVIVLGSVLVLYFFKGLDAVVSAGSKK